MTGDFPSAGRLYEALRKNNPDDNAILLSPSVDFKDERSSVIARRLPSQMTRGLAVAITRRRSSQIAGTLALLSPVGASLRQPKHWQVALRNEISRFIFSRFLSLSILPIQDFYHFSDHPYSPLRVICIPSSVRTVSL